jgi:hypothetical protein
MNVISEIFKKLDLKTNPLLISILVVLIVARVYYFSNNIFLNLSILLLGIYLFTELSQVNIHSSCDI